MKCLLQLGKLESTRLYNKALHHLSHKWETGGIIPDICTTNAILFIFEVQ